MENAADLAEAVFDVAAGWLGKVLGHLGESPSSVLPATAETGLVKGGASLLTGSTLEPCTGEAPSTGSFGVAS